MRKTACACLALLTVCATYSCADAEQKKSSVVTYYPAPRADYKTIRLDPTNTDESAQGIPGQIYYNMTMTPDRIRYYKKDHWENLSAVSSASGPVGHIPPKDTGPAGAVTGQAFYDNDTDTIKFINKTGVWINKAPEQYWTESALIPATATTPDYYNVYLINSTNRRVGIGTDNPAATLHVVYNDTNDPGQVASRMVMFDKNYTDKGTDQFLTFYMYPLGTSVYPAYKNSSVMIYATGPDQHFKFAAQNPSGSISFNVGGDNSSASEIMRLSNPGGASNPTPRVGVGNSTLPFALYIDSEINCTSVLAVRQVANQQAANWYKGGYWNIIPYARTLYIAYGLYCKSADDWYCDLFKIPTGVVNNGGSKIGIDPYEGIEFVRVGSYNLATGSKSSWDGPYPLFDEFGVWNGASSRAMKENFVPLDRDDVLEKIDQLDVSRWNYISEGPSAKRIGPVAEDFYRLFNTGTSEKILQPSDAAGVSLAGIKALSGKINEQQQQLLEIQTAIKDIRSQMGLRKGGLR